MITFIILNRYYSAGGGGCCSSSLDLIDPLASSDVFLITASCWDDETDGVSTGAAVLSAWPDNLCWTLVLPSPEGGILLDFWTVSSWDGAASCGAPSGWLIPPDGEGSVTFCKLSIGCWMFEVDISAACTDPVTDTFVPESSSSFSSY